MRSIVPTQEVQVSSVKFPVQGKVCTDYGVILTMELFGCSLSQVSDQTGLSIEEIQDICSKEDYAYIKNTMINNIRKLDQATLTGKIVQEAGEAFKRMTELSENAEREDVRFNANKDIMDRAMLANVAQSDADELRITFIKRR